MGRAWLAVLLVGCAACGAPPPPTPRVVADSIPPGASGLFEEGGDLYWLSPDPPGHSGSQLYGVPSSGGMAQALTPLDVDIANAVPGPDGVYFTEPEGGATGAGRILVLANGTTAPQVLASRITDPFCLAAVGGFVYVCDWSGAGTTAMPVLERMDLLGAARSVVACNVLPTSGPVVMPAGIFWIDQFSAIDQIPIGGIGCSAAPTLFIKGLYGAGHLAANADQLFWLQSPSCQAEVVGQAVAGGGLVQYGYSVTALAADDQDLYVAATDGSISRFGTGTVEATVLLQEPSGVALLLALDSTTVYWMEAGWDGALTLYALPK